MVPVLRRNHLRAATMREERRLIITFFILMFLNPIRTCGLSFVQKQKLVTRQPGTRVRHLCTYQRSAITMMPEGPEVRTLVDQLQGGIGKSLKNIRFLSGRYVRGNRPTGFADFAATMCQNNPNVDIITDWKCKGKFIYMVLDAGGGNDNQNPDFKRSIWITLGMTGRFLSETAHQEKVQTGSDRNARWVLELMDPTSENKTNTTDDGSKKKNIYYYDTRNFGTLKFCTSEQMLLEKLQSLGPDIFYMNENDFVGLIASQKRERNICRFLMDQGKLCGVGNYILAEGLYRSGVDPFCSVQELDDTRQRLLFRELQAVSVESYNSQGMTREKGGDYRTVDGERGQFAFELQCYGRDRCVRGQPVRRETNGPHGRTIWYTDEQLTMTRQQRALQSSSIPELETASTPGDSVFVVSQLTRFLTEPSWSHFLAEEFRSDYFTSLAAFLAIERQSGAEIYPQQEDIFSALNLCAMPDIKIVIVGQDPYHGPGQGHGLAFSVRKDVPAPPSLKNIFREANDDVGIKAPKHGNLEHWAKQGVLLLNTVLTVRRGEANSHKNKGWELFTDAVIQGLNERSEGLVFLLWGNPAHKKASRVDHKKHKVIATSHPSPLGATKTQSPFLGSRCFSCANAALTEMGREPVDWNIDGSETKNV